MQERLVAQDGLLRRLLSRLDRMPFGFRVTSTDVARKGAAEVCLNLGDHGLPLIPSLVEALRIARQPWALIAVRQALLDAGSVAVPGLLTLVADQRLEVRSRALDLLAVIVRREVVEHNLAQQLGMAVAGQLADPSPDLVLTATSILLLVPDESSAAMAGILDNLATHESADVRAKSAEVAGAAPRSPERCVPALIEALADPAAEVRAAAATALGRFHSAATPATPAS